MSAGNAVGLWNAVGYFASAVLGYDAHTGEEPEKKGYASVAGKPYI